MTAARIERLEDVVVYLSGELTEARARIDTLESQVRSLQLSAPRGIPEMAPSVTDDTKGQEK